MLVWRLMTDSVIVAQSWYLTKPEVALWVEGIKEASRQIRRVFFADKCVFSHDLERKACSLIAAARSRKTIDAGKTDDPFMHIVKSLPSNFYVFDYDTIYIGTKLADTVDPVFVNSIEDRTSPAHIVQAFLPLVRAGESMETVRKLAVAAFRCREWTETSLSYRRPGVVIAYVMRLRARARLILQDMSCIEVSILSEQALRTRASVPYLGSILPPRAVNLLGFDEIKYFPCCGSIVNYVGKRTSARKHAQRTKKRVIIASDDLVSYSIAAPERVSRGKEVSTGSLSSLGDLVCKGKHCHLNVTFVSTDLSMSSGGYTITRDRCVKLMDRLGMDTPEYFPDGYDGHSVEHYVGVAIGDEDQEVEDDTTATLSSIVTEFRDTATITAIRTVPACVRHKITRSVAWVQQVSGKSDTHLFAPCSLCGVIRECSVYSWGYDCGICDISIERKMKGAQCASCMSTHLALHEVDVFDDITNCMIKVHVCANCPVFPFLSGIIASKSGKIVSERRLRASKRTIHG
jgi:hypothetical protein